MNQFFILASTSRIRCKILKEAGIFFESCPHLFKEDSVKNELKKESVIDYENLVHKLAYNKAYSLIDKYPDQYILGLDQILICENRIFDKSKNVQEAKEKLLFLRGKKHTLLNGISFLYNDKEVWKNFFYSHLWVRNFSNEFLEKYLKDSSFACKLDSVGCYRFEENGIQLFDKVEGDYFSILGLPLLPFLKELRKQGLLND